MIKTVVDSFGQLNCGLPAQQLSNIFRKKSSKIQNVKLPTSGNINTHNKHYAHLVLLKDILQTWNTYDLPLK
jgi:hypothetical protein